MGRLLHPLLLPLQHEGRPLRGVSLLAQRGRERSREPRLAGGRAGGPASSSSSSSLSDARPVSLSLLWKPLFPAADFPILAAPGCEGPWRVSASAAVVPPLLLLPKGHRRRGTGEKTEGSGVASGIPTTSCCFLLQLVEEGAAWSRTSACLSGREGMPLARLAASTAWLAFLTHSGFFFFTTAGATSRKLNSPFLKQEALALALAPTPALP